MESRGSFLSALETLDDYDPNSMPVDQARQLIQQFLIAPTEQEAIKLHNTLRRALASDVLSPMNVPPHNYSAMDGYAVRFDDLTSAPSRLKIIGGSYAGHAFGGHVAAGECIRIMTGSLVPDAEAGSTVRVQPFHT